MMKKIPYPLTYLSAIWTPKKVFKGRKNLTVFQLILTFLVLNGLLLMPISLGLRQSQGVNVVQLMPNVFSKVNQEVINELGMNQFDSGRLVTDSSLVYFEDEHHLIGRNVNEATQVNQLILNENNFTMIDENGYQFTVRYTKDFSLSQIGTIRDFEEQIQKQWFQQNRSFVVLTLIMMTGSVIFISNLLIVLVGAGLLWFARKSQFSSIKTFKESVNLLMNAMGIGTLLGFITGWVTNDVTIMVTIQSSGIVLMLIATFFATRFNDNYQVKNVLKSGGIKNDKKTI